MVPDSRNPVARVNSPSATSPATKNSSTPATPINEASSTRGLPKTPKSFCAPCCIIKIPVTIRSTLSTRVRQSRSNSSTFNLPLPPRNPSSQCGPHNRPPSQLCPACLKYPTPPHAAAPDRPHPRALPDVPGCAPGILPPSIGAGLGIPVLGEPFHVTSCVKRLAVLVAPAPRTSALPAAIGLFRPCPADATLAENATAALHGVASPERPQSFGSRE